MKILNKILSILVISTLMLPLWPVSEVQAGIFNLEGDYGEDLYKTVYEKLKNDGSDMAMKRMIANQGLSQEELKLLISGASISEFMTLPDLKSKLSPQQIEARHAALERDLKEEKLLADLESQLNMEVTQTEIFANGDEEDSGFDLISDLDLIDAILFKKPDADGGGGDGGGSGGGSGRSQGNRSGVQSGASQNGAGEPGVEDVGPQGASQGSAGSGTAGAQNGETQQPASQQSVADTANVVCPLNAAFNGAVSKLRAEEKAAGAKTVGDTAGADSSRTTGGDAGAPDGSESGDGNGGNKSGGSGEEPPKPLEPEKPADWTRPKLCGEVFCLKFEAVYKKESSYTAKDNCIACHFEKINDSFKKLLDHGLVPSKVAGNLMEMPKCKRASGSLKFNLITVSQPIITPPNDDLVVKGDFIKNMAGFINEYYMNNPPNRAAESLLKQATSTTDPGQILSKIAAETTNKANVAAKFLKEKQLTSEAEDQASQYRVIMQEVDTMNSYFESFVQLFNQIAGENQADAPCPVLINLPQCS